MRHKRKHGGDQAEIDMTPMLDIVFIMLIFFIVTTSFVKEAGIDVSRPSNSPQQVKKESKVILVTISATGQIEVDNRQVDLRAVRANVENAMAAKPDGSVVIVAEKASETGLLVSVIDQARSAGAKNVSIAAGAGR
ncbi:MAG: biopolymer transporter ExbD [Gammaproteobacteria bacterium]|jgi:biopolymer transport protein ExbD